MSGVPNVGIRAHSTTLYNSIYWFSIYWFDDEMIINTHVYGQGAAYSPVLHVRRPAGGALFDNYAQSFDRVWNTATAPKW